MAKMRALVKKYAKPGLWMDEVDIPEPGIDDVVIKISRTAICGTDIHIYNWDEWAQKTIPVPMVVGHEYVGTVEKIGSNVKGISIGERVSGEGHLVCGHCRNCRAGRPHLCPNTKGVGVNRPGCFAEYLCIPATNVWHVDPKIDSDVIACFDPLGNAVHTALSYDLVGEDVLITGAGPIGAMAAAVCKYAGARNIVITDVNDYRLGLAKEMGATRTVNVTRQKIRDVMHELNMKEGFDVGLEMSGNPAGFNDMIAHMITGGKIALLGIPAPNTTIDWNKVVFGSLNILGIYGRKMFETWYKMQVMVQGGGLNINPIITHRLPIGDFEKGFELMRSGQSGKIVLNWEK